MESRKFKMKKKKKRNLKWIFGKKIKLFSQGSTPRCCFAAQIKVTKLGKLSQSVIYTCTAPRSIFKSENIQIKILQVRVTGVQICVLHYYMQKKQYVKYVGCPNTIFLTINFRRILYYFVFPRKKITGMTESFSEFSFLGKTSSHYKIIVAPKIHVSKKFCKILKARTIHRLLSITAHFRIRAFLLICLRSKKKHNNGNMSNALCPEMLYTTPTCPHNALHQRSRRKFFIYFRRY